MMAEATGFMGLGLMRVSFHLALMLTGSTFARLVMLWCLYHWGAYLFSMARVARTVRTVRTVSSWQF